MPTGAPERITKKDILQKHSVQMEWFYPWTLPLFPEDSLLTFLGHCGCQRQSASLVIRILYPSNNLRCCRLKPGYGSTTHSLRKDDRSLPSERSKGSSARRYKTRLRLYEISRRPGLNGLLSIIRLRNLATAEGDTSGWRPVCAWLVTSPRHRQPFRFPRRSFLCEKQNLNWLDHQLRAQIMQMTWCGVTSFLTCFIFTHSPCSSVQ